MKKSIVWLSSYPKSGNTWTRIFLANYLINAKSPVPINQVHRFGMGDSIPKMYFAVAGRQFDVANVELTLALRDKVLKGIVANNADVNFVKTHNTRRPAYGKELIPAHYTRSAVYIIRNPLDMVLSYARHYGLSNEKAVEAISRSDNANAPDPSTTWQFLGSWSEHVKSWTKFSAYPGIVLKYEDLLENPHEGFRKLLELIGVPVDEERLDRCVRFASFDEVSKQEDHSGFAERSPHSEKFFSKGTKEQWKSDLSEELIEKVCRDHRKTMKHYGYL